MLISATGIKSVIVAGIMWTFALLGFFSGDYILLWISILIVFGCSVVYAVKNKDNNIVYLFFLITFYTFMLGMYVVQIISNDVKLIFGKDIFLKESFCVFISLFALLFGCIFFRKNRAERKFGVISKEWCLDYKRKTKFVRKISRYCYWVTIICSIIVNLEIMSRSFGQIYGSVSIASSLPFFINKVAQMSSAFFWIYCSSLPTKKQLRMPSCCFVINTLLTLSTGVRGTMVRNCLALAMYYIFRNKIAKDNQEAEWISKRVKVCMIILIPIAITFLGLFANYRLENDFKFNGLINGVKSFFEQQGVSIDVIGRTIYCKDNGYLPDTNSSYVLGPIINIFKNGILGKLFDISPIDTQIQSVDLALKGNNLGATITYLTLPSYYSIGGGFGTSYIAELVADYGYIGLIIFNLFLGWLINRINFFTSDKWYLNAIGLLLINDIIYMPRDFALAFIASLLSLTNLIPIITLLAVDNILKNKTIRGLK